MLLIDAAKLLGLTAAEFHTRHFTATRVRELFAQAVKANHPDTAGAAGVDMRDLKKARDMLLGSLPGGRMPLSAECPFCKGSGVQYQGLRPVPCVKGCAPP